MPDHVSILSAGFSGAFIMPRNIIQASRTTKLGGKLKTACMTGCKMPWWIYSSLPRFVGRLHTLKKVRSITLSYKTAFTMVEVLQGIDLDLRLGLIFCVT